MSFKLLNSKQLRSIRGFQSDAFRIQNSESLRSYFVHEFGSIMPAEIFAWDRFSQDHSQSLGMDFTPEFRDDFEAYVEVFLAAVHTHPVLRRLGWDGVRGAGVCRLSDYCSFSQAQKNPLIQEYYKPVGANYQLAYSMGYIKGENHIVTLHRGHGDFSDCDISVVRLALLSLEFALKRLAQLERVRDASEAIAMRVFPYVSKDSIHSLTVAEISVLRAFISIGDVEQAAISLKVRKDTMYKSLASIREKLGFESSRQLQSVLQEASVRQRGP